MNWAGPILTDSGGYQIFSLAKIRKLTEEGAHFQNHLDGTPAFLSPEIAMKIQATLGSDIAMVLDECPPWPCEHDYAAKSLELTTRWAKRSKDATHADGQLVFGIVQGATFPDLRREAAEATVQIGFDGYAIGGVSVGEPEPEMMAAVENSEPYLPNDKPRYCMGLGTPPQIIELIARGVDMFDCVLPTRLARNGTAFTASGTLNLKNAEFTFDKRPIEEGCTCPACREFTRGYIRHLVKAEEILGLRLITLHNLHFYLGLATRARETIENGTFADFRCDFVGNYKVREPAAPNE
jgi:queuine tRNA-ribosyltransferase